VVVVKSTEQGVEWIIHPQTITVSEGGNSWGPITLRHVAKEGFFPCGCAAQVPKPKRTRAWVHVLLLPFIIFKRGTLLLFFLQWVP
jgi:hypothetical protein